MIHIFYIIFKIQTSKFKMYLDQSIKQIKTDWKSVLEKFDFSKINEYFQTQHSKLEIYPPKPLIFNCFNQFDISKLKVLIIGLDPYIRKGQAMGMSFSVPEGVRIPPSLRNIFKEIDRTFINDSNSKNKKRINGDLTGWAKQGVLLFNTALTVFEGKTGSHKKIWNEFTKYILAYINEQCEPIICMLWGRDAEKYKVLLDDSKHYILIGGHPSPLNRTNPFIGNNHFVLCNEKLKDWDKIPINWQDTK